MDVSGWAAAAAVLVSILVAILARYEPHGLRSRIIQVHEVEEITTNELNRLLLKNHRDILTRDYIDREIAQRNRFSRWWLIPVGVAYLFYAWFGRPVIPDWSYWISLVSGGMFVLVGVVDIALTKRRRSRSRATHLEMYTEARSHESAELSRELDRLRAVWSDAANRITQEDPTSGTRAEGEESRR